jgi:hypothetical protein
MKKSVLFLMSILGLVVVWSACSRDRIEEDLNEFESPNTYLDSKKQDEQVFVIDSAGTGPIIGNQGTAIWGGIDCLRLPNGDTIDYPFVVKLVELYSAKDMIYYQMPTVGQGSALESAGEIRLRAEKDGQLLSLAELCAFKVSMPNLTPQQNYMSVFYGNESVSPVDWRTDLSYWGITALQSGVFDVDTIGYTAYIEKLGWINADRSISSSTTRTFTFDSDVDDLTNVAIFVYLPGSHTVLQAEDAVVTGIPNGVDAKVIAIAVNGSGTLFHFYDEIIANSNQTIMVEMSSITDANLTNILDSL